MSIKKTHITFLLLLLSLAFSCKDKNKDSPKADFDRKAMLTNLGNQIIIPAYRSFQVSVNQLDSAITAFNLNPDISKLQDLQITFKNTYRAWQLCSPFAFGPAEQEYLGINTNTFPTNIIKINTAITTGSYNLNAISNMDMKGLPGIDYLLFGIGSDNSAILEKYTVEAEAANRKKYLKDLSSDLQTKLNSVLNAWLPGGGNYINTFMNAEGTDIGSSLGLLTNMIDHDLDGLKNYKLGIPLGKQSAGVIYPEKVEGYYCGISAELLWIQMKAVENIYLGKSSNNDGVSYDDYLTHIDAKYNGGSLNDAIKGQFTATINKLQAVPDPLSATIINNADPANVAYKEVQKLLVLMKTDMTSSLGILITYVDNDGD